MNKITRKLAISTLLATICLSTTTMINSHIIYADDVTVSNSSSLKDSTLELKKQSKELLLDGAKLKNNLNNNQSKVLKQNNKISNVTVNLNKLKTKKENKQDQLNETQNEINLLDKKIKKQKNDLQKIYQDKQEGNNKSDLGMDSLDPSKAIKDDNDNEISKELVKNHKTEYKEYTKNLSELKDKQANLKSQSIALKKTIAKETIADKKNRRNKKIETKINSTTKNNKLKTVQAYQNKYNKLEDKYNLLNDKYLSSHSDNDKTIENNLKATQDNLNKINLLITQMTGKAVDNIKVDAAKLAQENQKLFEQIQKERNNHNDNDDSDSNNDSDDDNNSVNSDDYTDDISDDRQDDLSDADDSSISVNDENNPELIQNIINKALSYVGTPYVWGGSTPNGFDCSGLMQYVFNYYGVSLPRVSQQQSLLGKRVEVKDLQPGDLVFWGSEGYAHHVALFIGNGNFVQAPEPGQNVKVTNIAYFTPDYGKRIL